jgi:penicillin-binding protein 2
MGVSPETGVGARKTLTVYRIVFVVFLILVLRLLYLQVFRYQAYVRKSIGNKVMTVTVEAPRGEIFDRNGKVLAKNEPQLVLMYFPPSSEPDTATLSRVEARLGLPAASLASLVSDKMKKRYRYQPIPLFDDLDVKDAAYFRQNQDLFPGVYIESNSFKRLYTMGRAAAHIVGYIGRLGEREVSRGRGGQASRYEEIEYVGRGGVEEYLEGILHGKAGGQDIEVDKAGRFRGVLRDFPSVAGDNVYLTMDANIQREAFDVLAGHPGAIIVSDPKTGEILAMVSEPDFDANRFRGKGSRQYLSKLMMDNKNAPLLNRAYQNAFPPGSTFKPLTALAALESGLFTENSTFYCAGKLEVGKRIFWCWNKHGHGALTFREALAQSCDVSFYTMGEKLGADRMKSYADLLGFDSKTGIDLPSEVDGLIPTPAWKKRRLKEPWYTGDTLNMAIGQGYIQVTPLQVLWLVNTIVDDGAVPPPHVLRAVEKGGRVIPSEVKRGRFVDVHSKSYRVVREGMRMVVTAGTAKELNISGLRVAGKTGTAEDPPRRYPHSWFVGYFPADNPKYSFVVFLQNGGNVSEAAVGVAKQLVTFIARYDKRKAAQTGKS